MSTDFTAADARARGLAAHLFTRTELETLAGHDGPALARAVGHSPKLFAPVTEGASTLELERVLHLTARHHLCTLARWEGAAPVLNVFYADQDRRSLRAMFRGSLATAPAEERLAGLIPTPTLAERVLSELARQPTPALIAAHLFALGHPAAPRLLPLTQPAHPDLLLLELALTQAYAQRATHAAKRGDEHLRRFVALRLDVANVQSALLLSQAREVEAEPCFVEGGGAFLLPSFLAVVGKGGEGAMRRLRDALEGTPLAPLAADVAADAARVERAAFSLALAQERLASRREPLSSAPVLHFLLRLEAQGRDLRRILWGAALGAPATLVRPELVTP